MGVAHPVSRNFKTHFPDIPSKKVANPASRKRPAGPHQWMVILQTPFLKLRFSLIEESYVIDFLEVNQIQLVEFPSKNIGI